VFESDFQKTINSMPVDTEIQRNHKQLMEGIQSKSRMCQNDLGKINELKDYLTKLDSRRGTNWKQTFPWLEQIKT
jgi:hypothetical protein